VAPSPRAPTRGVAKPHVDRTLQCNPRMSTRQASISDIRQLLGDVDPLIAERIVELGASPDEIAEALRSFEDEMGFGEQSHEPSSERVAEIRALLHEELGDQVETEDEYRA
jgi:hypothetical protein